MPLDPAFEKPISQTGTIPVLIFEDDRIQAVYDQSPFWPNVPAQGDLVGDVLALGFNLVINSINTAVAEDRKRTAYKALLPVVAVLSSFDLTSDVGYSLTVEMRNVQWLKLGAPVAISQKSMIEKENNSLKNFDNYPAFLSSLMSGRSEHFYLWIFFAQRVQQTYSLAAEYRLLSKDDGILIYRNRADFVCSGPSSSDWVQWWTADDGRRLRAAYTKGVQALAQLVAFDLGARSQLEGNLSVARSDIGQLTATCPTEWWK